MEKVNGTSPCQRLAVAWETYQNDLAKETQHVW